MASQPFGGLLQRRAQLTLLLLELIRSHGLDQSTKESKYNCSAKDQVLSAYQDRMSLRGIKRTFGVCYQTVMAWVGEKMAALPAFESTLLPGQNGDVLELDELWSFVEKKTQECWLWVALCRRTRQVVAYTIGDRSKEGALSLREHVPPHYRRRATRSDFWLAYEAAFPRRTHRFCGKAEGETNHVERFFGTLRARMGRLVRRAYSFSMNVERHLEAIHLFITGYNLQIKQSTLG
jgi:insertion element IS1 protein InsB